MGEVYRARDVKLKREVAIKLLPDEYSRDADRLARFQREAEALAALNHPHIAAIYVLEESGDSRFLVMELVEGETLSEQISRGPMSMDQALEIAVQLVDALRAAHDRGIVHRDLKPANIKITPEGRVKVLDLNLWVYDRQRDINSRLPSIATIQSNPLWSPDGRNILFQTPEGIFWISADGAGKPQPLTKSPPQGLQYPWSFTTDGTRLAYHQGIPSGDLWTLPVSSDDAGLHAGTPEPFLRGPADERHPTFSPDGRWLAYDSDESGSRQVYVRAFPDKGRQWRISSSEGEFPAWSRDTNELFFRTVDSRIVVASYAVQGDSFVPAKPRIWSETRPADPRGNRNFDLAPDGKRILTLMDMDSQGDQGPRSHVNFLQNFFDELKRRVR